MFLVVYSLDGSNLRKASTMQILVMVGCLGMIGRVRDLGVVEKVGHDVVVVDGGECREFVLWAHYDVE